MSLENGKCPSCGGALLLDSSKEKLVCKYCGHELIIQQALQKCVVDGIATFDTVLLSAQRILEVDGDFDKAVKKYKEALNLKPDDYRVLWGIYLCEIEGLKWARGYKGYVQVPGDINENLNNITSKYGQRAYNNAPEDVKWYYKKVMNENVEKLQVKKKGCYVATCVYGSYDCPEVWVLRRYRDNTLDSTWYGRAFIRTYYTISPSLVKIFGNSELFKKVCRAHLDKMVTKMQKKGVENTPYNDKY